VYEPLGIPIAIGTGPNFFSFFSFFQKKKTALGFQRPTINEIYLCPQAGRPRRRNATAPGAISLRSIHASGVTAPVKVAYAATGIFFLLSNNLTIHPSQFFVTFFWWSKRK